MKQDIRDLFKEGTVSKNKLPDTHRQEFYQKLKASRPTKHTLVNTNAYVFKIAATLVFIVTLSFTLFTIIKNNTNDIADKTLLEQQIETVEKQYLASIDKEWQNFLHLAQDQNLILRYEQKLSDLDKDYQALSEQLKQDGNNILVIEALVDNLQTRLQLLKDIQEHIKLLNQKTEHYENTI